MGRRDRVWEAEDVAGFGVLNLAVFGLESFC